MFSFPDEMTYLKDEPSARSVLHPLEEIIGAGTADQDFETALRLGIDAQSAALQFYYALDC